MATVSKLEILPTFRFEKEKKAKKKWNNHGLNE